MCMNESKKLQFQAGSENHILISDGRYEDGFDITSGRGDFLSFCYTLDSDDIRYADRPSFSAYNDRKGLYNRNEDNVFYCDNINAQTEIMEYQNGIHVYSYCRADNISLFGLNFPLNFLSMKNGFWKQQFVISSPYCDEEKNFSFCYFKNFKNKNLLAIAVSKTDGFRICYSDFLCGHFFQNFQFLCKFDKAYSERGSHKNEISLYIIPVANYNEALERLCGILKLPALTYTKSSVLLAKIQ